MLLQGTRSQYTAGLRGQVSYAQNPLDEQRLQDVARVQKLLGWRDEQEGPLGVAKRMSGA